VIETSTFLLSRAPITVNVALKRKENLFLYLIKLRAIKMHGGVEGYLHEYKTSARLRECSALRPGHFILGEMLPALRSLGGLRISLGALEKRKVSCVGN
jgi:hypothetical protein